MDEKAISSAIFMFSVRFLDELDKTRSVVSSPLSAEIILALLALGATEQTLEELLTELGFHDADAIRKTFVRLSERLKNIEGATLDVANKIYMNVGAELEPEMQRDAVNVFNTDFEIMDFKDGDAVAKHANDWVKHKTHQKIEKILIPSEVDERKEMFIINAIYFKGNWAHPFDKAQTSEQEFFVDSNTTIMVPMMRQNRNFKYGNCNELQAEILVLPYSGEVSKMAIILPHSKESDALNKLLKNIKGGYELIDKINGIGSRKVIVNVPKFKIESEIKLTDVLKKEDNQFPIDLVNLSKPAFIFDISVTYHQLGIKSMFNTGFDKLVKSERPVHVSDAIQKAVIEVNEEGTEAAAVTKMALQKRSGPRHFIADHPFLYILLGPGDTPLFMGIYRGDENAPRTENHMRTNANAMEIFSVEELKIITL